MGRTVVSNSVIRRMMCPLAKYLSCVFNYFLVTTFILVIMSYSAAGCTPNYIGEDLDVDDELGTGSSSSHVVIKEGSSFEMTCRLNKFDTIKWTLNRNEINAKLAADLGIYTFTHPEERGLILTELKVFNATKLHSGQYRCVPICLDERGNNDGVKVTVIFGEDPTVNGEIVQRILHDGTEGIETRLVRFTMKGREKEVIKCNATSVKSIDWVQGESKLGKQSIMRCKDKKMKRDSHESDEAFHKELDAPCTVEVKVNDEDEGPNSRMSQLNLVLNYIQEKDFGPYTCITKPLDSGSSDVPFGTTIYVQPTFQVMRRTPDGKPFDKGHRSITVIEGNILSIYCNVTGVNVSHVSMKFYKDDVEINLEEQRKNGEKVQIWSTQFATGFDYLEAEAKHKGSYKCVAHHDGKPSAYQFLVRIKGKLQPLWPFLGICGEVAVLCIIIVVYEKRRNKQELEESDTDGSPDQ